MPMVGCIGVPNVSGTNPWNLKMLSHLEKGIFTDMIKLRILRWGLILYYPVGPQMPLQLSLSERGEGKLGTQKRGNKLQWQTGVMWPQVRLEEIRNRLFLRAQSLWSC